MGVLNRLLKTVFNAIFLAAALPAAALAGFGRFKPCYSIFANLFALAPGIFGDYLRIGFYHLTLAECPLSSRIQFGSFFAHPEARVGARVYIGSYCILGKTIIGERTQIASGVQILSGSRQHVRDEEGRISGAEEGIFAPVAIGADCWIGAAAIVMADVGAGSTVGAGSVVSRPIPVNSVAVGSPAKVIRTTVEAN
jgi:virginiamycin A acetyltransferase